MADSPTPSPLAEIRNEPSAFERFLDRNTRPLIVLTILLALAAAAWVVYRGMKDGADRSGGAALVAAEEIPDFEAVVSQHADSPASATAAVLLSDLQWDQGQQDASIATLRQEIEAKPDHPATAPARARLGDRLAAQGKTADAKATFQALLAAPAAGYLHPYALVSLAGIAKGEGDLDAAENFLTQVTTGFSTHPLARQAQEMQRFLRYEMPKEVAAPAPAPEEAAPAEDAAPSLSLPAPDSPLQFQPVPADDPPAPEAPQAPSPPAAAGGE